MMEHYGWRIYVIVLICLMLWPREGLFYYQYPSVFWTPKNCRFNLNKPKANNAYKFSVKPHGKLYFICPNVALWSDMSSTGPQLSMMYENLYIVDKAGYDTCTVDTKRDPRFNRQILRCDSEGTRLQYVEETFSDTRADPTQMRYYSGKTYYFISTSNGTKESLDNLSGGHCKTHRMKLKIIVCDMEGLCPFDMPKCPYSYVFYEKPITTKQPTTQQPTTKVTSVNSHTDVTTPPRNDSSKFITDRRPGHTSTSESSVKTEKTEINSHIRTLPITKRPSKSQTAELSSEETIWGTERKHIIIHITTALLILVLSLSLIYIWITRRKQKSASPGFNSKMYQERPTSVIPLNSAPNGEQPV